MIAYLSYHKKKLIGLNRISYTGSMSCGLRWHLAINWSGQSVCVSEILPMVER